MSARSADVTGARVVRSFDCEAVLFDMDGTLIDSRIVVERGWRQWAARHGLDPAAVVVAAQGRRTEDTVRRFCPEGVDPQAEIRALLAAEEADVEGIVALAGASSLLAQLPPGRWAVVTSAHAALARNRIAAARLPIPRVLVTAEDVVRGKPDPEGFQRAAAQLGFAPHRCLAFEDAPAGVVAAQAAGATVVIVTGAQHLAQPPQGTHLRDYRDIRVSPGECGMTLTLCGP